MGSESVPRPRTVTGVTGTVRELSEFQAALSFRLANTFRIPHSYSTMTRALSVALLLVSYVATACTSAAESSIQAEISDSAGLKIVHNRTPRWTEDQRWVVPPDPVVAIGVLNGPEEYQLVDVADAARRSDGSVVVVDRGAQTVRLYDPQGTFQKILGGPGAGPGEFTDPVSVLIIAGDTVIVWDQALLRVTRFGPQGDLTAVQTVDWGKLASRLGLEMMSKGSGSGGKGPGVSSSLFPGSMEPLGHGGFLTRLVEKAGANPPTGSHRPRGGALRVSEDLSVIDTLMFFGDTEQVSVDAPWGPFSVTPPGAKQTRIAHRGNPPRICIGDQEESEIRCFAPDGGRSAFRWVSEPVLLTEYDVAAWREETVRLFDLKLSRDQVLEMLDQVPVPEVRPTYSQILLDPMGNLWVERGPTGGMSGTSTDFLVFDSWGILLGLVTLPPVQVMDIGLDYVLGVYEDELEIQYVRIHELRKPFN